MKDKTKSDCRPFLKWAGGKTQLLNTIDFFLPYDLKTQPRVTYIEPFVGGGAMLFYMLQNYSNIKKAVINDINIHLIKTYITIKKHPFELIKALGNLQFTYNQQKDAESKKDFYLSYRERFNNGNLSDVEEASLMIFLNRTCFNGLYRENAKGKFNVPFGKYVNPQICDPDLILNDSALLQNVLIQHGDFADTYGYIEGYTLYYCDPPYRPIDLTSRFNSYVKTAFNDEEQIRLRNFVTELDQKDCYFLLSNSDGKSKDINNNFFDDLYSDFFIERVLAKRSINSNPLKRGLVSELLIRNYPNCQGKKNILKTLHNYG